MNPERQNRIVIGIILIIIILGIFSIIFYQIYRHNSNFFEYNGFTVYGGMNNGLMAYQIQFFLEDSPQPFVINSRHHPEDLEDIPVYSGLRNDLLKEKLYVTMEPTLSGKATIAFAEINKYIENPFLFNVPTFPALLTKVEDNDLPKITCGNVSRSIGVIMFKISEKNQIYGEDGCVILEAVNEEELIRGADRLSLTVLGVMELNP